MDVFQALILSIVEGITEFLPISSTGHLVLTSHLLGITQTEFVKSFEIFIQLGAILAVVVLYAGRFMKNTIVWKNILIAFLPTAVLGFTLYKVVKDILLGSPSITLLTLFLGGIFLIVYERFFYKEKNQTIQSIEKLSAKQAFLIGLAQSVSMVPGVSRAGATIVGGLFTGLTRKTAVEFSFLLAVPTMLAASGYDLLKSNFSFSAQEWGILAVGFIGSFIVALFVIKFFIKFIQTNTFEIFGWYRIILAVLYFLFVL